MRVEAALKSRIGRSIVTFVTIALSGTVAAQEKRVGPDLSKASLEDLMNVEITGALRKEQRLGDVPAAVYVITQADIARSGMTTVPELLRLAPGVQVSRINANKWAVAVRGFNGQFADKLLVLIDGRTVYDRLNSGVFWESLDVPLDQIERIEVIRGAGGATWGANAVNGVISIVTKPAGDTPGGAVALGAGTFDGGHVSARYGGTLGGVAYRVFSQWAGHGDSRIDARKSANDRWESQAHGFRADWTRDAHTVMFEGGAAFGRLRALWRPPSGPVPAVKPAWNDWSYTREYTVLGRWSRRGEGGSALQVQSFFHFRANDDSTDPKQAQTDVDAQYHARVGGRHDVVIGGGYRFLDEDVHGGVAFSIVPNHVNETVVNAFAQDEIAVGQRLRVTLGAKVERDTYAGWGVQPTARVMWSIVPHRQHVWGAVSRALRTPSLSDVSGRYNFTSFVGQGGLPVVVGALGNPDFHTEEVLSTEAGHRLEIGSAVSVDVTGFVTSYDKLKTSEPLAPRMELAPDPPHLFVPVQFGNLLQATVSGVELGAQWTPVSWYHLEGSYSAIRFSPHPLPASRDTAAASSTGNVPRALWQVRSAFLLGSGVKLDAMLFHAGPLAGLGIDAYTRGDIRVEAPLTRHVSVAIEGQNLFDPVHAEYAGASAVVTPTLIPRSAQLRVRWEF